jgi:hypothetical protein
LRSGADHRHAGCDAPEKLAACRSDGLGVAGGGVVSWLSFVFTTHVKNHLS